MSVSQALEPELPLGPPRYFTDSKVSLYWIKGQEKEWKQFVQNRVNQIRALTSTNQWEHCAGTENPAIFPEELIPDNSLVVHSGCMALNGHGKELNSLIVRSWL